MEKQKRQLDDRVETYYLILHGKCGNCGLNVTKVIGSDCTNMSNGDRFHYEGETSTWCIFRCKGKGDGCGKVISDTWNGYLN